MVELRKRPPPKETATQPPAAKRSNSSSKIKQLADKAKAAVAPSSAANTESTGKQGIKVGDTVNLDGFGGELQTHDGNSTTLKDLIEKSGAGVVVFTYPKASTPGCK